MLEDASRYIGKGRNNQRICKDWDEGEYGHNWGPSAGAGQGVLTSTQFTHKAKVVVTEERASTN